MLVASQCSNSCSKWVPLQSAARRTTLFRVHVKGNYHHPVRNIAVVHRPDASSSLPARIATRQLVTVGFTACASRNFRSAHRLLCSTSDKNNDITMEALESKDVGTVSHSGCEVDKDSIETAAAVNSIAESVDWCAYYINLARRSDRRENLLNRVAVANTELLARLERVDAVDGQNLNFQDESVKQVISEYALERAQQAQRKGAYTIVYNRGNLLHFDNHLTIGGIACAMSHRLALEKVAQHPTAKWGLILEDDITDMVPRADAAITKIIEDLPPDWNAVFLGYHDGNGKPHPSAHGTVDSANGSSSTEVINVGPLKWPIFGLFAWVVRKEAACELLEHAFPISGQVDHALSQWLFNKGESCYAVEPENMVFFSPKSEVAEDSDVQTMATVEAMIAKYESWEGYYDHIWGLSSLVEDYMMSVDVGEDEDDEEGLHTFVRHLTALPCDMPPPDCPANEFPDL